jgi:hypothetical protein
MERAVVSRVFQVTEADVERSTTLEADDVGRWVFLCAGTLQGFCESRDECEQIEAEAMRPPPGPPPCPTCGGARRQCETGGDGCWHCDTCDAAGRAAVSPPGAP